jgi:hypothetical protein
MKKTTSSLWLAGLLSGWAIAGGAQTQPVNPPPAVTTTTTASESTRGGGGSPAETRIVSSFSTWAGSEDNARSLVTGLRQGREVTLTAPSEPAPGNTSTTFTSPTRPMGYGNVRIALSLAREQLAQSGITEPTPAQLETALMGGSITTTGAGGATTTRYPGVLQMRADGMGWGQIANSMGVKLGHVMSGKTSLAPVQTTAGTAAAGSTSTASGARSGITTGGGASSTTAALGRGNSAWAHQTHPRGAGIVTANGNSAAGVGAGTRAHGGGSSAGIVTGAGVAAGGGNSAAVRAQGKGHVNPR